MKMFVAMLALALTTTVVGAQDAKQTRCCNHMCPVAQQAVKVGFTAVARAPVARVSAQELLS